MTTQELNIARLSQGLVEHEVLPVVLKERLRAADGGRSTVRRGPTRPRS